MTENSAASELRIAWLIAAALLAWAGNFLYALGTPDGWLKEYSPAVVATSLIGFVILHGRMRYGGQIMGRFAIIVFVVAWIFETISVVSGFPFGNYHYTEIMAPYLWHVPVFVLPAYALMGYASWSLAELILGRPGQRQDPKSIFLVPIVAACAMVVWDLSMDPLRATIEGRWIWHDGGAHFGVPISNYFGWFGVTWLMFQIFAIYLSRVPRHMLPAPVSSRTYWFLVPVAYSNFAGEYLLNPIVGSAGQAQVHVNGLAVPVSSIQSDVALICLATMIPLAIWGAMAVFRVNPGAELQGLRQASPAQVSTVATHDGPTKQS